MKHGCEWPNTDSKIQWVPLKAKRNPKSLGRIQRQAPEKGQTQWALVGLEKKDQELLTALSHRTPQLNGENENSEMLRIQHWELIAQHLCSLVLTEPMVASFP